MLVKIIKQDGRQFTYQCSHIGVTTVSEGCPAALSGLDVPGVTLELMPKGPTLRLPDDGEVVYVMNDAGNTVDSYRWPPEKKEMRRAS